MDRTWRVLELLAAKTRIEEALTARGIQVDSHCRQGILRALSAFSDKAHLDIDDAERRIVMAFVDSCVEKAA